ncbi:MAG: FtsQ-type POTRA domain-containing protein [Desulfarculaceae bacterium]|nr:FtsQ-type POTRA domain-containing protein [Desulfarculaceae bacterium]
MNKKAMKNRYKREPEKKRGIRFKWSPVLCAVFVLAASTALVFLHDFVVQMNCFTVDTVTVEGNRQVPERDIVSLSGIRKDCSVLSVNLFTIEKRLLTHPWIQSAAVERKLPSGIRIRVKEQEPLAIVKVENLADILINTQGMPFKEYSPENDNLSALPVISGLELTRIQDRYMFNGRLFNSVFDVLQEPSMTGIKHVKADKKVGLTVTGEKDGPENGFLTETPAIELKLGFNHYAQKFELAEKIETYFENRFERKIISSIDLFNPDHIIVKTKWRSANCRETKT